MNTSLQVVDDFLPHPLPVREAALRQDFSSRAYQGHSYNGIATAYDFMPQELIEQAVGFLIEPVLSFFRLGVQGDETTTFIHSDCSVSPATHAGVLYLSDPPPGIVSGTAFYRHRLTGWASAPDAHTALSLGFTDLDGLCARLDADGDSTDHWLVTSFVGMRFNRFVIYPANVFHSRFPRETWGISKDEGRLIWACFFKAQESI